MIRKIITIEVEGNTEDACNDAIQEAVTKLLHGCTLSVDENEESWYSLEVTQTQED